MMELDVFPEQLRKKGLSEEEIKRMVEEAKA